MSPNRQASDQRGSFWQFGPDAGSQGIQTGITLTLSLTCCPRTTLVRASATPMATANRRIMRASTKAADADGQLAKARLGGLHSVIRTDCRHDALGRRNGSLPANPLKLVRRQTFRSALPAVTQAAWYDATPHKLKSQWSARVAGRSWQPTRAAAPDARPLSTALPTWRRLWERPPSQLIPSTRVLSSPEPRSVHAITLLACLASVAWAQSTKRGTPSSASSSRSRSFVPM